MLAKHIDPQHPSACDSSKLEEAGRESFDISDDRLSCRSSAVHCPRWCVAEEADSQSRIDLLSAGGYRMDGRRPLEIRSMEYKISPHRSSAASLVPASASAAGRPDGSAQVTQGLTSVCVYIYGPREPGRVSRAPTVRLDRAGIHVEMAVAPWGGIERRHRARNDRCSSSGDKCVYTRAHGCGHSYGRLCDGAHMWPSWFNASPGSQPDRAVGFALCHPRGAAAIGVEAASVIRDEMDAAMRYRTEKLAQAMSGARADSLAEEERMAQDA
ncbi:Exosome non-catalytic core component [Malassezia obtusa]|uniref:Exosome non-catalytic core component n=1 Tax=Malassezia obtusa TaxID=76774 RepID=A0AAF0E2K2_9BASI|nr:Exosome non-catalytic core component [Malassezia obtusa]